MQCVPARVRSGRTWRHMRSNLYEHREIFIHIVKAALLIVAATLLMTGCGKIESTEANVVEKAGEPETAGIQDTKRDESDTIEQEEIDYPFPYGMEGWRLKLCTENTEEGKNVYRFRLYDDADNLTQNFPCELKTENLIFRFDRLYNQWAALAVFPANAESSHGNGLLFTWDYEIQGFVEEPIEIPWYDQVYDNNNTFIVTETDEQNSVETQTIYCFNSRTRQPVELRRWIVSWDGEQSVGAAGELYIWDCLEEAELYNGEIEWKAPGQLVNDAYYQSLFREDLRYPWGLTADETIPTAKYILGSENDMKLENIDYESRDELLESCGFQDAEPFYQYYDHYGNLKIELYLDESAGKGCGFQYSYGFNYDLEKVIWSINGFNFEGIRTIEWEDDTFSLLTWEGTDAREHEDVTQVIYGYADNGELSSYEVRGITEYVRFQWEEGVESLDDTLLSIDWVYRSDGTLYRKYYHHDPMSFATTGQSQWVYYDKLGRPVYRDEYITHGSYDYYYIYDGENITPKYCLSLDQNGGYSIPVMYVYQ